jgi:ABC-type transporter Mla maintaining outer membrane lipid asymmetry ATPase subunit MlaF
MDDAAIQARGLRKAFDQTPVLAGVDLTVPAGTLLACSARTAPARRPPCGS